MIPLRLRRPSARALLSAALVLTGLAAPAGAAEERYPPDAGFIDVTQFGAHPDDGVDDTQAILAAIGSAPYHPGRLFWRTPIVFFPAGTYLVSDTLVRRGPDGHFTSGMVLVGASRERTVLRLKDRAAGFGSPAAPKPIVMTTARLLDGSPTSGGKDYLGKGEGNDAYANYVENLTIDVGEGNPGAIALDFLANNVGAVRNVTLAGHPGSGAVGLAMTRKWIGPALISGVSIAGFDIGVDVASSEYGVTIDDIAITGSRIAGLRNAGNMVSAHKLSIAAEAGPAVANTGAGGLIVIQGGDFSGAGAPAFENAGYLNLSGIRPIDVPSGLPQAAEGSPDGIYSPTERLGDPAWSLPVREPPEIAADAPDKWVSVAAFGAKGDGASDATAAIRAAFASGARTVYFPHGVYAISDALEVPATVERIEGMFSTVTVLPERRPAFDRKLGMLRLLRGERPLMIRRLAFDMTDKGKQLAVELTGRRALVLSDIVSAGTVLLDRGPLGGEVFAENLCCGPVEVAGGRGVWLRQFNSEGPGVRLANRGAPVWVLGTKVERNVTVLENSAGGSTELVGGLVYQILPPEGDVPLLVNESGRIAAAYVEEAFRPDAVYRLHLVSKAGGRARELAATELPPRGPQGLGRIVPQLVDGP